MNITHSILFDLDVKFEFTKDDCLIKARDFQILNIYISRSQHASFLFDLRSMFSIVMN